MTWYEIVGWLCIAATFVILVALLIMVIRSNREHKRMQKYAIDEAARRAVSPYYDRQKSNG